MAKYQPYTAYKDSGIEWAPECPVGWDVVPTFAVCNENRRRNTAGTVDNVLSLSYGRIIRRDVETNFGLLPESFNTYQIVQPGHVVMRLTDLQNDKRSLRVGFVEEEGIITSAYLVLQFNRQFIPKFAYYLLHAYDLYKVYYGMGGGLRQTMRFDDLKGLPLFCPPVSEQETIAAFLDHETARIDRLITKQERLIELLKEKRQAVISHAVTKGLNPDAPMKDSGVEWLGEVPAHWAVSKIRYVAKLESGHTPSRSKPEYWENCSIPWFTLADVWQIRKKGKKYVSDTKEMVSQLGLANSSARLLPKGTVILSRTASVGFPAIMPTDMATSQDFACWISGEKLYNEYLYYSLLAMRDFLSSLTMGSTHKTIYMPDIADLRIALPPADEQESIVSYVEGKESLFEKLIAKAEKSVSLLQEHRTALISAAVTGKIDVRNWQNRNSEPQAAASAATV